MVIKRASGIEVRQILTGMIVDRAVVARISLNWPREGEGLFSSPWANVVAGWCVNYFHHYDKAPGRQIVGLFEEWAAKAAEEEVVNAVERFLSALNDEYEELVYDSNPDYLLEKAQRYFNLVRLRRLIRDTQEAIDRNDVGAAHERMAAHREVRMTGTAGIDILSDKEAWIRAFERGREGLFSFPGALGEFFGVEFEREAFIGLMAPEKRGKTLWLLEKAVRAMLARRKVVFVSLGDMSERQVIQRLGSRLARRPLRPRVVQYPVDWEETEDGFLPIREEVEYRRGLEWQDCWRAVERMRRTKLRTKENLLKIICEPGGSFSVADLDSRLSQWAAEGWVADVVVLDYMDNLRSSGTSKDERHNVNVVWADARGLSLKWHLCLIGATQTNRASYGAKLISRTHSAEDKRKLAHVTGMYGINQTRDEKLMGLFRLNCVALREEEYDEWRCVLVAGCPALASPAIRSVWSNHRKDNGRGSEKS